MNKLWTVVLVLVVAAAAFFLGRQYQAAPAVPATPAATVDAASGQDATATADPSAKPLSAEPPRTFRGPDGLPRLIAYEAGVVPDNSDRDAIRKALLADMTNHPRNIERSYDLTQEQIEAIVAGKEPFPEILLPKPGASAGK